MRAAVVVAALLAGCGSDATREPVAAVTPAVVEAPCPAVPAMPPPEPARLPMGASLRHPKALAGRPYTVNVPADYDFTLPVALVVEIHGFGDEPSDVERLLDLSPVAAAHGALLVVVTGSEDRRGRRFWNATDACCDVDHRAPDDVAYLDVVLDDVEARFRVDTNRVWLVGHSNGGFMAHRYACDRADRVAGFVSVAGAGWLDPARCAPSSPVAALQISGDADPIVHASGGTIGEPRVVKILRDTGLPLPPDVHLANYPDVHGSLAPWITRNGCQPDTERGPSLDLDYKIGGSETTVERWRGCRAPTELWTMHKAGHVPAFRSSWAEAVYEFLSLHPKG